MVKSIIGQKYYESNYWPGWTDLLVVAVKTQKVFPKLDLLAESVALRQPIGWLLRMDLHSTWQLLHHRAFNEVIARAMQSVTLRLLTLWSAGSTPRPTN